MKGNIQSRGPSTWRLFVNLGRDAQGRRRQKTLTVHGTKAEAQKRLREILADMDRGIAPPERILLRDWLQRWHTERTVSNRWTQATIERYECIIRRHLVPNLGHVPLAELRPAQVREVEANLVGDGLSPRTVELVHTVLSGDYRDALQMEMVFRSPVSLVSPPAAKRSEIIPPSVETVRALLRLAEEEQHPQFAAMHLVAYTGMRVGEVLALTWASVNLDDAYLIVRASVGRRRVGFVASTPKTAFGQRRVDLDAWTVEILRKHRELQAVQIAEVEEMMPGHYRDIGLVFPNDLGGWMDNRRVTGVLTSLGKRVGHPAVNSRALRHFHASVALQTGQNPVVVSRRVGHSKVSTTVDLYAHSLPGWQKEAADAFAAAMADEP